MSKTKMMEGLQCRSRLLPERDFPPYAYIPGRSPHPVRDRGGHSFGAKPVSVVEVSLQADEFLWGIDLFNHGFYWEAHEAWEPLWRAADLHDPRRPLLKALILLAAAGVKVRERKHGGIVRHARRAAALLRDLAIKAPDLGEAIGMPLGALSDRANTISVTRFDQSASSTEAAAVFSFVISPHG